mgnify:CR=1 FL=1
MSHSPTPFLVIVCHLPPEVVADGQTFLLKDLGTYISKLNTKEYCNDICIIMKIMICLRIAEDGRCCRHANVPNVLRFLTKADSAEQIK